MVGFAPAAEADAQDEPKSCLRRTSSWFGGDPRFPLPVVVSLSLSGRTVTESGRVVAVRLNAVEGDPRRQAEIEGEAVDDPPEEGS